MASVIPSVLSIPTAASATPYVPAISLVSHIAITTTTAGISVLSIPSPKPPIITVAGPVSACCANFLVGLNSNEV